MFNFLYVIHNYNAPLAIALLEALTKNPATYPFLYNDLIDSPSQPKIVQIIQGLQDANSRENVIVLLERMTQSETNVLPQCLKAVPDLVRDLLPLLDSPEIMNHFAHIIVQAVEKHPPSRKQLKTPSALQQLIRLYIDSSEEPHHRDLYILLKFALGKKVMGIWLRDSDVQDRVTPIEIARLRHRCADNSALYRLL
jgi:hypothetical protein